MAFIAELWSFLRVRKRFWLLPVVLVLMAIGGLLIAASGFPGVSFSGGVKEPVGPLSKEHYRHERVLLSR